MARPGRDEYPRYYDRYIDLVPEDDVVRALADQASEVRALLENVPESVGHIHHAPYTWSVKEVVGHLTDCERIMGYRALRFSRGDSTPLPGFEENDYVRAAGFDRTLLRDLTDEWLAVRQGHRCLFRSLDADAWARRGEANGNPVTVRALAYIIVGHTRHHVAILRNRLAS